MRLRTIVGTLTYLAATAAAAGQETIRVADTAALQQALDRAQPGTTILIAPGKYRGGLRRVGLAGAKGRPIRIAAQDSEQPPVIEGGAAGLHLVSPQHVELSDLVFTGAQGNGLNIDDGGRADAPAQHILLKNLQVRDVAPRGNRDGIKLSGLVNFVVEGCTVERWGEGGSAIDMVGCRDGRIVRCTFREARGEQANGVQTKGGSRDITIARCRFNDAGGRAVNLGGSTGLEHFRPRPEGFEAKDIIVEDSIFVRSSAPIAFVGVDGAVVRHNIIFAPSRWVLRILQENQGTDFVACRRGEFENNIIAWRSADLRAVVNVGGGTEPASFQFSGNAWYCLDRPDSSRRAAESLPSKETGGTYGVNPRFRDPERDDVTLAADSPLRKLGVRPEAPK